MSFYLNKEKRIGSVIYIVEGYVKEFTLLKHIFTKILDYDFIEVKGSNDINLRFISKKDKNSKVCVIKSETSNISSINSYTNYLDEIFKELYSEYDIDVNNSAVYFIFDRDRSSNKNPGLIKDLLNTLNNSRDNEGYEMNGLLLMSYPALESYIISCFEDYEYFKKIDAKKLKEYLNDNNFNQNLIKQDHILRASNKMIESIYQLTGLLINENHLDNFGKINLKIFGEEEKNYHDFDYYILLSLLSVSFWDLGIISNIY